MSEIGPPPLLSLKTQLLRFVLTGGFSAIVDFGLYYLLYKHAGLQVDLAKAIGFVAGTLTAYLINRRWTFGAEPSRSRFIKVTGASVQESHPHDIAITHEAPNYSSRADYMDTDGG